MAALKTFTLPVTAGGTLAQVRNLSSTKTAACLATFSPSPAAARPRTWFQSSGPAVASQKGAGAGASRPSSHRRAPIIPGGGLFSPGELPARVATRAKYRPGTRRHAAERAGESCQPHRQGMARIENLADQRVHLAAPEIETSRARSGPLAQLDLKLIKLATAALHVHSHANG